MTANRSQEQIKHNQDKELRLKSILRGIVERGLSVNSKDDQGEAALHLVMQYWGSDHLGNVPKLKTFEEACKLPLNPKNVLALTRLFLANGAEVDPSNRKGETPLHIAIRYRSLKRASILLKYGADANASDNNRATPLHYAISDELVNLLLTNGALVNAGNKQLCTPLYFAVKYGYLNVVPILLEHGARVSFTDQDLKTPLHLTRSSRVADLLLSNGAVVDARDKQGFTPLHVASGSDLHNVIPVLLKFGADVNAQNQSSQTALQQAVESDSTEKKRATIRLLLKFGANANVVNRRGYTVIQEAISSLQEENILALLERNVEVFPQTARHQKIDIKVGYDAEKLQRIGRLIDASLKLTAASLSPTRDNLIALGHNPRKDYFSLREDHLWFGQQPNDLKIICEAEVERLKNHIVTDTMSLHNFMLTGIDRCVPSKSLLDSLQMIDYATYPTYEDFLISKFRRLKLMLFVTTRFNKLLKYCRSKVRCLPKELTFKILVHLDNADMKNLISCTNKDI